MGHPTTERLSSLAWDHIICFVTLLCMQGHILLDTAVFPEGTPGATLDVLARVPLWQDGLNYRHGTGVQGKGVLDGAV